MAKYKPFGHTVKLTAHEIFFLLTAIENYTKQVEEFEFPKGSLFTKEYVLSVVGDADKKIKDALNKGGS